MTHFDRFDIVEAYYLYFVRYHRGQSCPLYARLCKLRSYFTPSPSLECGEFSSDNAQAIYAGLAGESY